MDMFFRKAFLIMGIICVIYGLIVIFLIGTGNWFSIFYLCAGVTLLMMSRGQGRIWKLFSYAFFVILILFILVEIRIISYAMKGPEKDADYLIVLGSQVKAYGPSVDYRSRLEKAYEYLLENEDTVVITTGAQGHDEPVSEGRGGSEYLKNKGLDEKRILIEENSYDTLENIRNAGEIIKGNGGDIKEDKVVIVSAIYHLYRASYIAEKVGYGNVSCYGGHGLLILLPHYFTREFFALIKEWIVLR